MSKQDPVIKSVETTLRIVEHLETVDDVGVTELAEKLGLSPATTYNHLNTLHEAEYVEKTEERRYRLGFRVVETAYHAKRRIPNYGTIVDEVDHLAEESGEIALFTVEEHGVGVCLSVSSGDEAVERPIHEGYRSYLHDTAVGKAILAFLPHARVEQIVERRGLPDTSANTITDEATLFDELMEVREQGLAFNREEAQHGLVGVGAPILRPTGRVLGAISIIGPTSRISESELTGELAEAVQASTNIIEVNDRDGRVRSVE